MLVRRRVDEAGAWEHKVSAGTYGAPRIRHALMRGGVDVGARAVAASMRRLGLERNPVDGAGRSVLG